MTVVTRGSTRSGWRAGALAGTAVALVAGLALNFGGSTDPLKDMLSNGVSTPTGAVLLAVACLGLVGAAGSLAVPLRRSPGRLVVLGVWAAGLLAVALCPTRLPGQPATSLNEFHRYGAIVTVVAPLVLGLSLGDRRVRAVSLLVGVVALGYGVTQGPLALVMIDPLPYEGLAERVVLALLLVEVTLIARTLAHCTTSASADPLPPTPVPLRVVPGDDAGRATVPTLFFSQTRETP